VKPQNSRRRRRSAQTTSSPKAAIKALLFDLDGTLYRQRPLRNRMIASLATLPLELGSLREAQGTWRAIQSFRRVRESLRSLGNGCATLAEEQYTRAAQDAKTSPDLMERIVVEWLHERPLPHLHRYRQPGAVELLDRLSAAGIRAGVFSDYPAVAKLEALRLGDRFAPVLAATDENIHAFKPHPAGLLEACRIWNLSPSEVLYVGDRPEVDAAAASAAGMRCAIIGASRASSNEAYRTIDRLEELYDVIG
jgi:HAD superfamily hydrolase (TIGR01549 family)